MNVLMILAFLDQGHIILIPINDAMYFYAMKILNFFVLFIEIFLAAYKHIYVQYIHTRNSNKADILYFMLKKVGSLLHTIGWWRVKSDG